MAFLYWFLGLVSGVVLVLGLQWLASDADYTDPLDGY